MNKQEKLFWFGLAHMILWALKQKRDDIRFNVIHDINGFDSKDKFFSPRSKRFQEQKGKTR